MPKNLHQLAELLPKSKYEDTKLPGNERSKSTLKMALPPNCERNQIIELAKKIKLPPIQESDCRPTESDYPPDVYPDEFDQQASPHKSIRNNNSESAKQQSPAGGSKHVQAKKAGPNKLLSNSSLRKHSIETKVQKTRAANTESLTESLPSPSKKKRFAL